MQTKTSAPPTASASTSSRSEIAVEGMTCSGCARNVTNAIQGVAGVQSAAVSLEEKRVSIRWASGASPDLNAVLRAVTAAGYEAKLIPDKTTDNADAASKRASLWSNASLLGIIATAMLMAGEWIFRLGDAGWYRWLSFALASLVQFGPGRQFYRGAWNQLKARSSNMDTLVALGSTTAYAYSVWALFTGNAAHLYFMEAAAIITLISVGHLMEARVSARASDSLKALMNLAPATARRRDATGAEREIPVAELTPGDVIALRAGERIPTDGVVIEGNSAVDESMLTGESMPVEKTAGATAYTGTMNQTGHLVLRVTSVGEQTALAGIIAAVERAQSSRANIQRLGDRISNVFVPIVVMIAIAAGLWWGLLPEQANQTARHLSQYLWHVHPPASPLAAAILAVVAVLIIACPCAMGLATPAAIMAGANAAARRGILIRDGVALEKAGTITAIVFDKTGTLTEGRPTVAERKFFNHHALAEPDILTASLASMSNHPLSAALSSVQKERVALSNFVETAGKGLCAHWPAPKTNTAAKVRLGSLRWLENEGISTSAATTFADQWMSRGATIVAVSVEQDIVAAYALRDPLKPGARALVDQIVTRRGEEALGLYLISGDAAPTVQAIAAELGLDRAVRHEVFAAVPPERKAEIVKQLQQRGERVAFVGDGINDGPALEQADLGIAVSRASDVAREAADIILLRSDIEAIPESLALAKATLRTIRQNLFWAFFYNALGIPLAALGFMSPVLCAAAMGLSDLVVIGNALRLRRWKFARAA